MTKFWEQYDRAFGNCHVQGYALIKNGEAIGSVAVKYPRDGAGRLQAFAWWINNGESHTARGTATGCGYDKTTAAVQAALSGTPLAIPHDGQDWKEALKAHGVTAFATIRY